MAYDAHANGAYSTVLTAPSPASSGTSIVVQSGDGARFPAVPFNATVWPAGAQPLFSNGANAEIVRVTARSTDTLTVTRAQESTSARTIVVGDQIAAVVTAKTLTDMENQTFNAYKFLVYRNAALNSPNNTGAVLAFDTKVYDTGTNIDVVTNKGRFTAPVAGFYKFSARVEIVTGGVAHRIFLSLYKNGSELHRGSDIKTTSDPQAIVLDVPPVSLAANDFIEVEVFTDAVQTISVGSILCYFGGFLVSLT